MNKRSAFGIIIVLCLLTITSCFSLLKRTTPDLYAQNLSAVVEVDNNSNGWYGTGFVVDKQKGLIMSAAHLMKKNQKTIFTITFQSGEEVEGIVYIVDFLNDLLLIKVKPKQIANIKIAKLEFELEPTVGGHVYSIGNPGQLKNIISLGILSSNLIYSSESLEPPCYFLTDIHIFEGNSVVLYLILGIK